MENLYELRFELLLDPPYSLVTSSCSLFHVNARNNIEKCSIAIMGDVPEVVLHRRATSMLS